MPKVSRPVVYTALAAVAAYALFLNTQPDTPTAKRVTRTARATRTADPNGLLPADLNAHFPRYTGGARDPFAPGVALKGPRTAAASRAGAARTGWALTGINSVNGVASALLENGTGDSVFLQPGDRWNGLRVVSIKSDRVLFQNALGRQDTLTFAAPTDTGTGGAVAGATAARPGPGLSLPPYPVTPLRTTPFSGGAPSLPTLPPLSGGGPQNGGGAPNGGGPQNGGGPPPPDDNPPPGPQGDQ